jgi:hypothetical protein
MYVYTYKHMYFVFEIWTFIILLFLEGKIIQIMTFNTSKTNGNYMHNVLEYQVSWTVMQ